MLSLLLVTLGAVIYVSTDKGELKVEFLDPDGKPAAPGDRVDVRVNGQEVILDPDGRPITVRAGDNQKVVVTGPDFETVSESFDLTRGKRSVVRVTLLPKGGVAQRPKPEDKPRVEVKPDVKPAEPPKPVPYPKDKTLIATPGWEILADATKEQMQAWLDAKKKAKHSVLWLDAIQVDGTPIFSALAALDDRQADWVALLSVPIQDLPGPKLIRLVDTTKYVAVSFSGYFQDGLPRSVLLFHPAVAFWMLASPQAPDSIGEILDGGKKQGGSVPLMRAYPAGESCLYVATLIIDPTKPKTVDRYGMSADDFRAFIIEYREKGYRPNVVSTVSLQGELRYTAVMWPDAAKSDWKVEDGLTAAVLKEKAVAMAKTGFRPSCVTAYPWDGAVRYCVVWVKDPPKPVGEDKKRQPPTPKK